MSRLKLIRTRCWTSAVLCGALMLACAGGLLAQNVASSIMGTVVDPSGAVIPGAKVHLVNQGSGVVRDVQSNRTGLYRFPNLPPGIYNVTVSATGFKNGATTNIDLGASTTRDLGKTALQIGQSSEEVTVTAAATPIQTSSSAVDHTITGADLAALPLRGRDLVGSLKLDPGVTDLGGNRDVTQPGVLGGISIDGNTTSVNFTVDGISDMDTGCANCIVDFEPNMDSIQEVKVLSSNYSAEYGRNSGGTITVVTKSGTTKFHGSGWINHRHEEFNANDFFNNASGRSRPLYRYNVTGWSFGGPVDIGWLKNKLFFFASQEYTNQLGSNRVETRTTPTAQERGKDPSQLGVYNFNDLVNSQGQQVHIYEPGTGVATGSKITATQFPNDIIPANQVNTVGLAMLNFFPLPNYTPAPGSNDYHQANFTTQASAAHPRRNDILRIDFNPTSKLTSFFRWGRDADNLTALFQGTQFNIEPISHPNPGHGYAWSATYVLSPTLINEATVGLNWNTWSWYFLPGALASVDRSVVDNPPTLLPLPTSPMGVNGYDNIMPRMSFGGAQANMMNFGAGTFDYHNANTIWTYLDNVSKVAGAHQLKFGIYAEHNAKLQPSGTSYIGSYNFGEDTTNPLDSGDGFANALLGNYDSFGQNNGRPVFNVQYWDVEFYGQDSWRATRKLTLDYGLRFYHDTPQSDANHTFSYFDPNA
ncbi:MAG TPA: carboxypeptidase regulatory-like domain-containing protein, partial [Terriglobales bacterium]